MDNQTKLLLELTLLKMWADNGLTEVFKYKNRIRAFREPLVNIELFYDLTYKLFEDVEDIADYQNSAPEDFKVSVEMLIKNRKLATIKPRDTNVFTAALMAVKFFPGMIEESMQKEKEDFEKLRLADGRDWQKDKAQLEKDYRIYSLIRDYHLSPIVIGLYWLQEAEKWRIEAFRKYPTPEAYDAACAALHKHKDRATKAERKEQKLKEALEHCINEYPKWDSKEMAASVMLDYMKNVLSTLYSDKGGELVVKSNTANRNSVAKWPKGSGGDRISLGEAGGRNRLNVCKQCHQEVWGSEVNGDNSSRDTTN